MTQTISKIAQRVDARKAAKKALLATALLAAFGAANAFNAQGASTKNAIVTTGGSTFANTHFHGPNGAPGVGFLGTNGQPQFIISLQSISLSSLQTGTPANESGFTRYYLPGYTHTGPGGGGSVETQFNWAQVPTTGTQAKQVYFGLATNATGAEGAPAGTAAFYVGDRDGFVTPASNTNYATVALLSQPSATSGASPTVLQGNLALVPGVSLTGNLTGAGTLNINATSVNANGFSGASSYNGATGETSGQFFGGGTSSSALGGIANGSNYVASFGGVAR